MERSVISIGLLHYPVYNKNKEVVTTSITTSSLHDISRTARTFGVEGFYIITPIQAHRQLVERLIQHWQTGYGAQYNPTRRDALENVVVVSSLGECLEGLKKKYGREPVTIVTCARRQRNTVSYEELRERMRRDRQLYFIIFGTGWGIEQGLMETMDFTIEPIYGQGRYNHLSVRAAVAIILDRLINENR
ncbi:MAG: RNA methyltransferase [bacterium]|nr:RNA methyltransferase [bacterium]